MRKTVFITGCSSGIGRVTAKFFHEQGWNVVATVRKDSDKELSSLENLLLVKLDITDEKSIEDGVSKAIERFKKIDVLVNNAGYATFGTLESLSKESIKKQFKVNAVGTLMMTKGVLSHMRKEKSGTIINISSACGKVAFPLGTLYHGAKFAIEGMSEALSYELNEIGVKMKIVEPGSINTKANKTSIDSLSSDPAQTEYSEFVKKVTNAYRGAEGFKSEPIDVAKTIYMAATSGNEQLRYIVGKDAYDLINNRKKLGDSEFMAKIRQMFSI